MGSCAETPGQSDTCAAAGWRMQSLGRGIIQRQLQKATDKRGESHFPGFHGNIPALHHSIVPEHCKRLPVCLRRTVRHKGQRKQFQPFSLDYTQLIWYSNKESYTHTHTAYRNDIETKRGENKTLFMPPEEIRVLASKQTQQNSRAGCKKYKNPVRAE